MIVTYGDRGEICRGAVRAALAAGAEGALVVDNGSSPRFDPGPLGESGKRVMVERSEVNLGSAGGFALGLRKSLETGAGAVWLLDDDNEPEPDALAELRNWREHLTEGEGRPVHVISFRPQSRWQERILTEGRARGAVPSRSSFLSFNVRDIPGRLARRSVAPLATEPVSIPYGAYGGLLLDRATVESVGLPNAELFTYADDSEFTRRIVERSGPLYLVPSSRVTDTVSFWYDAAAGRTPFTRLLNADSDMRLYYTVRNRTYFERTLWFGSAPLYWVNRSLFVAGLCLSAILGRRISRLRLVLRAIRDGDQGNLGVVPDVV